MNVPQKSISRPYGASTYIKLAWMAGASIALMAAISNQLPADAAEKSTVVSIADLDLSTGKGMEAARERVHEAARQLCKKVVDPWSLSHQPDYVLCVNETTAEAVTKLQVQQLLANASTDSLGRSYP